MARSANAGRIAINLSAGTAQFVVDMEQANAKIRQFGQSANHTVTGVQATSAALRTLEGGVTNNLRAAENFLAKTLGLGEALKVAFPVVGAIALGGVLFELVKKAGEAYEAFRKLQEAPKRIAQEFDQLAQPIRITNDELAVSNDRLANEIAKLQGKPQNNLSLALHEAALSSDKLAESLNRAFESEQKLLESEAIGNFKGFFTGSQPTQDLADQFKKFRDGLTEISLETNARLEKESDPSKRAAIYQEASNRRIQAIQAETGFLRDQLQVAQKVQDARTKAQANPQFDVSPYGSVARRGGAGDKADQSARISTLRGELDPLQAILAGVPLQASNDALKRQKESLEESAANAKLDAPVKDKIAELQSQLRGLKAEAAADANSDNLFVQALTRGAAEADKAVTELNKRLEPLHQKVSFGDVLNISDLERSIALTGAAKKSSDEWNRTQKEIVKGSQEVSDRIAQEETQRQGLLARMQEQIDEAKKLASVEVQGADAIFQAQLKIKLARIEDPDVRAKTQALDEAEHAAAIEKTVVQLQRETDATNRLKDAVLGGDDARRKAELENIGNSGADPEVIAAQQKAKRAQFELQDATELKNVPASAGVQAYFQQLVDQAQSAAMQVKEVMTSAFEGINENLSRAISGQKVSWAGLFQSLSAEVAKAAIQNAEVMAVKKFGGSLFGNGGNSGSSSPWDEKAPGGGGLFGKIGSLFGLGGGAGTRDGSSASTAFYVTMTGAESASAGPNLQKLLGSTTSGSSTPGDDSGGGFLGGLFGFASSVFGGFRAAGGSVDPGQAYVVGENGPELFRPPSSGAIVPNHQLGGSTAYYTIDARGTDPAQTEQRVRAAIIASHNSSVHASQQISQERVKRTPQN